LRDHLTVACDHAAEGKIALARFIERHADEALVLGRRIRFREHGRRRQRGRGCKRDDNASAAGQLERLGNRMRVAVIAAHVRLPPMRFGAE
jgi:hypothetical protein